MEQINDALIQKIRDKFIGEMLYIDFKLMTDKPLSGENGGIFYPSMVLVFLADKKTVLGQKMIECADEEEVFKAIPGIVLQIIDKVPYRPVSVMCCHKKLNRALKTILKAAEVDCFFAVRPVELERITASLSLRVAGVKN